MWLDRLPVRVRRELDSVAETIPRSKGQAVAVGIDGLCGVVLVHPYGLVLLAVRVVIDQDVRGDAGDEGVEGLDGGLLDLCTNPSLTAASGWLSAAIRMGFSRPRQVRQRLSPGLTVITSPLTSSITPFSGSTEIFTPADMKGVKKRRQAS